MITLNEKSSVPIYQQIYDGILKLVILKVIGEGEKLPSVRELAIMLQINPNTIQKAYRALEEDGYIVTVQGKGNFAKEYEKISEQYLLQIQGAIKPLLVDLLAIKGDKDAVMTYIYHLLEEVNHDKS